MYCVLAIVTCGYNQTTLFTTASYGGRCTCTCTCTCPIGARSVAGVMSNGAPSADAKRRWRGERDGGRDRAMSRGGMSCDGATSVGKASNGRTMTGGMTSGAATTIGAEASASATGTIGAMMATIPGATMTGATAAARGSLSTAIAG